MQKQSIIHAFALALLRNVGTCFVTLSLLRNDGTGGFLKVVGQHPNPCLSNLVARCNRKTNWDYVVCPCQCRCNIQCSLEFAAEMGSIEWNHRSHKLTTVVHESRDEVNAFQLKRFQTCHSKHRPWIYSLQLLKIWLDKLKAPQDKCLACHGIALDGMPCGNVRYNLWILCCSTSILVTSRGVGGKSLFQDFKYSLVQIHCWPTFLLLHTIGSEWCTTDASMMCPHPSNHKQAIRPAPRETNLKRAVQVLPALIHTLFLLMKRLIRRELPLLCSHISTIGLMSSDSAKDSTFASAITLYMTVSEDATMKVLSSALDEVETSFVSFFHFESLALSNLLSWSSSLSSTSFLLEILLLGIVLEEDMTFESCNLDVPIFLPVAFGSILLQLGRPGVGIWISFGIIGFLPCQHPLELHFCWAGVGIWISFGIISILPHHITTREILHVINILHVIIFLSYVLLTLQHVHIS